MIQKADMSDPRDTMHAEMKCAFFDTRSHPKTRMARKLDSRKKVKMASAARGAPKMSPTYLE